LKYLVHLDRFKWTNLNTNLTTHADRDIDIEDRGTKLRLAHVIGLLVFALNYIDALWRTFLLANLACHTAYSRFRVIRIVDEDWEVSVILRQRTALLRI